MKRRYYYLLIIFSLLFLNACGGGGSGSTLPNTDTFPLQEKQFLHNLFLTEYLWYDQVTSNVDYAQYSQPQEMIDDLRVDPPDHWSYVLTEDEYEAIANQKTVGFGFAYNYNKDVFKIYFVRIGSPAWGKLQRGDEIIEVNGEAASDENIHAASQRLDVATTFTVLRKGNSVDVSVIAKEYTYKVTSGEILPQGSKKIGYMRFDAFTESATAEIETLFSTFHLEQIDELVIDLRYNSGGSVDTASAMLDNITNRYPGQRQMYLNWNANYQSNNSSYYFEDREDQDGNELALTRVIFLVTKNSASASEALINALVPYLGKENVITIGEATHGKPVGMWGRVYRKNYYFLINFTVNNNAGRTTSFDGIPPVCPAEDDLEHFRGDANETMLKAALNYIETGRCL
jgi:C-terminal processing protease CtpA/Prc